MLQKPRELTLYKSEGFEVSAGGSGRSIDAATALSLWKGSPGHNQVIVNSGMWRTPWRAFGVGIYGGYAVAWFGQSDDPAGSAAICK